MSSCMHHITSAIYIYIWFCSSQKKIYLDYILLLWKTKIQFKEWGVFCRLHTRRWRTPGLTLLHISSPLSLCANRTLNSRSRISLPRLGHSRKRRLPKHAQSAHANPESAEEIKNQICHIFLGDQRNSRVCNPHKGLLDP